jgi:hypothetical protein
MCMHQAKYKHSGHTRTVIIMIFITETGSSKTHTTTTTCDGRRDALHAWTYNTTPYIYQRTYTSLERNYLACRWIDRVDWACDSQKHWKPEGTRLPQ